MFKKFAIFAGFLVCAGAAHGATEFETAAQLLSAARAGNVQLVETMVNSGANINFVDNTGLSIVCTALMNKDIRAAQILQTYGADASRCDQQIKQFNGRQPKSDSGGLFSGLSTTQNLALAAGGAAIVAGGLIFLSGAFSSGNKNAGSGTNGGNRPGGGGTGGGNGSNAWSPGEIPIGPSGTSYNLDQFSPPNGDTPETFIRYSDFNFFKTNLVNFTPSDPTVPGSLIQNYMLTMRGYSPLARGYNGMRTLRRTDRTPFSLSNLSFNAQVPDGGRPIGVALITPNGVNPVGSIADDWLIWAECSGSFASGCTAIATNSGTVSRKYFNNVITGRSDSLSGFTYAEEPSFDLSGNNTVFNANATDLENLAAKVIGGWIPLSGRASGDYIGFMPNGQLIVYRTGGGTNNLGAPIDYNNWKAMLNAAALGGMNAAASVIVNAASPKFLLNANMETVSDVLAAGQTVGQRRASYYGLIDKHYDVDTTDLSAPSTDAFNLLTRLGPSFGQLLIMPAGGFEIGAGDGKSLAIQQATFENAAPALYDNLNHLFMTVVAVQLTNGTNGFNTVSGFENLSTNKISLSVWSTVDNYGAPDQVIHNYASRACGVVAANGTATVDPWCFAAAGATPDLAASAMGGAAGLLSGAFAYMDSKQIFTLMALTADGPYLGTSTDGTALTAATLTDWLKSIYALPNEYQFRVDNGEDYLKVFAEVYGYGLVNLERATKPGAKVYYFDGSRIVSGSGNAYWRNATVAALSPSSAIGARAGTIKIAAYDYLTSLDGSLSMPRIFENNFTLTDSRRGLYMGDVLGDFGTRVGAYGIRPENKYGFNVDMSLSESAARRSYNTGGLDELSFSYNAPDYAVGATYQNRFKSEYAHGALVRGDLDNPILTMASNAVTAGAAYRVGAFEFGGRGISGSITDEGLMETDPAISGQFQNARLGGIAGAESFARAHLGGFDLTASGGMVRESDTVLGSYSNGLLAMGGGDTTYIDAVAQYNATDDLNFIARATFARTRANPIGEFITGMSALDSNAFSVGANWRGFSIAVAQPLAVTHGNMKYASEDYGLTETENGYALTGGGYVADLNMAPTARETRFTAAYRTPLGEFTDGAIGFIYRIHPNNTNQFGNESVFMLKMTHRLGI